jgi:uncharacterized metal-binding protein YceD (DUF177 family)
MRKDNVPKLEFSRPLIVDRVPRKGSHEIFAAEPKECTALALRLDVPAIHSVKAHLVATPWRGGGLKVTGDFTADLEQVSVVSLEAFRHIQKFEVERFFLPPKIAIDGIEEDADIIDNGIVDLGELVAETMGLEIEAYPRKAGEEFEAHLEVDEEEKKSLGKLLKLDKNSN